MGIFCSFIEDESDHFIETRGLVCHIFELAEIKKMQLQKSKKISFGNKNSLGLQTTNYKKNKAYFLKIY